MSYEVIITREDDAWLADVPSAPGAHERADLTKRESAVKSATAEIVVTLTRAGYSVRDAAALVGLTPGRISQLTTITTTTTTKRVKAKPSKSKKAAFTKIKPVRAAAAASPQRRRSPASGVL